MAGDDVEMKGAAGREKPAASGQPAAKKARTGANGGSSSATAALPGWEAVHEELNAGHVAGVYGGPNSVYFGLAGIRAGVNMDTFHTKRGKDEVLNPDMKALIVDNPKTRTHWDEICTIDPLGLVAKRPTMASTTATMDVPELRDQLEPDGVVVNDDKSMNIVKTAVDYVWNLPRLSARIGIPEDQLRESLAKYTANQQVRDTQFRAFLPPTGALTVYIWGDPKKLADKSTEVAVRVHDQCTGSDVFGTDICTCRPYLVYAIKKCVECAQRGGVGVVVYFQKEGRSLGEVTKYRVYNARKAQEGGDSAEKYFYQTESIAGIRDARFQEMMPDALLWLGIKRIDWLLSMSSEKYDAITSVGIKVMQRVALPDDFVPKGAGVEINAKIASGYHSEKIESAEIVGYLQTLEAVRARTAKVYELAKAGNASHFRLDESKIQSVVDFVTKVTVDRYGGWDTVPYHSRWGHFKPGSVEALAGRWRCDKTEVARRKVDLAFVSVLLDAGAGNVWRYTDSDGVVHTRSEGIAVASLDMFEDGIFSSDKAMPHRVNALGLATLSQDRLARAFQTSQSNRIAGLKGRWSLLRRLGEAIRANPEFFGHELARPGNLVDFVLANAKDGRVSLRVIWRAIIEGLELVWPNHMSGIRRGDMWAYNPLKETGKAGSDLVPFHKLSQWLTLSLLEPLEELGLKIDDMHLSTGLPEYRNGGLFVDLGVLSLIDPESADILHDVGSEIIVEWRALTVQLLDRVHDGVLKAAGKTKEELPLSRVLQGGTWQAGRLAAAERRENGPPPIQIRSNGSVF